jgi:hypothetical protein
MSLIRQGYLSLAKVQVDGSNPLARSIFPQDGKASVAVPVALVIKIKGVDQVTHRRISVR